MNEYHLLIQLYWTFFLTDKHRKEQLSQHSFWEDTSMASRSALLVLKIETWKWKQNSLHYAQFSRDTYKNSVLYKNFKGISWQKNNP